jgi:hypothetical protein
MPGRANISGARGFTPSYEIEIRMGILSWFFGKPSLVQVEDKIWLTREAKNAAIAADLQNAVPDQRVVVLLAHFPDTLALLKDDLPGLPIPLEFLGERISAKQILELAARHSSAIYVGLQRHLVEHDTEAPQSIEPGLIRIVIAERHPIRPPDDSIVAFARSLGCRCQLHFHMSLDEPLMRIFAGDWVAGTLRRLGMKETDVIESSMVQRRVAGAQKHIGKRVLEPKEADSAEEWMSVNGVGGG